MLQDKPVQFQCFFGAPSNIGITPAQPVVEHKIVNFGVTRRSDQIDKIMALMIDAEEIPEQFNCIHADPVEAKLWFARSPGDAADDQSEALNKVFSYSTWCNSPEDGLDIGEFHEILSIAKAGGSVAVFRIKDDGLGDDDEPGFDDGSQSQPV